MGIDELRVYGEANVAQKAKEPVLTACRRREASVNPVGYVLQN
jgi:hypothetical protein